MKVRIKTAHNTYLRAGDTGEVNQSILPGPWEEFELEAIDPIIIPPPPSINIKFPVKTDFLELRDHNNVRVYHSIFPNHLDKANHWLDALVSQGYTHAVAEANHQAQNFVPGDNTYSFINEPEEFLERCRPAFDRRLQVIVCSTPEGNQSFNVRKFIDKEYPKFISVIKNEPRIMANWEVEINELFNGYEVMELVELHHSIAPELYFLIHFNTGISHPDEVKFADFWFNGVTYKGRKYKPVLHAKSILAYQFPKSQVIPGPNGFLSTLTEIREETIAFAVTRKIPFIGAEYSHKQTQELAKLRGQEVMKVAKDFPDAKILGFMNGG